MIRRLHVKNFRSLRDVTLEPGLLNVFVGPNSSGKSNYIDSLKFLTDLAKFGLSHAFSERGGFTEVFWKGTSTPDIISFDASFDVLVESSPKPLRFDYVLEVLGSRTGLLTVKRELLHTESEKGPVNLIDITSGHGEIRHLDGTKASDPPENPSVSMLEFNLPKWAGSQFKQYLACWHFYKLVPALMKQLKALKNTPTLTETGDNLIEYLTTLKTSYSDTFKRIERVVQDTFPDVQELNPQMTQYGQVFLTTKEKFLHGLITVWNMADGELAFIALLARIFSPPEFGSPVICVEEPENHLHPRLLETLVEVLKQNQNVLQERGIPLSQIFATTHSPHLVDRLNLEELIVFEKQEGETRLLRPTDKAHLKDLLSREEMGLGELWYSGALGGV